MFGRRLFAPTVFPARCFPEGSGSAPPPPSSVGIVLIVNGGATQLILAVRN